MVKHYQFYLDTDIGEEFDKFIFVSGKSKQMFFEELVKKILKKGSD